MRVLIDTCCIIWAASDPDRLTNRAKCVLLAPDTTVFVSAISCAEIACLSEGGRVALDRHWKPWFDHVVRVNAWMVLDIDLAVIQEAYSLPGTFHRDPADRILVGTARHHDVTIMTSDRKILDYPHVATVWHD